METGFRSSLRSFFSDYDLRADGTLRSRFQTMHYVFLFSEFFNNIRILELSTKCNAKYMNTQQTPSGLVK